MLYIFDMGNVVVKDIYVLEETAELLGVDSRELFLDYKYYDHPLMDGVIHPDDYYKHLEHVFDVKVPGKPFSDFFHPKLNEPMVQVIEKLKAQGHRIVAGSNTFKPHWDIIEKLGYDRFFDRCYLSHEMGITKPLTSFFKYILKEEKYDACDTFFTDDFKENIDAAASLGIKTLWYRKDFDDSQLLKAFNLV